MKKVITTIITTNVWQYFEDDFSDEIINQVNSRLWEATDNVVLDQVVQESTEELKSILL